jgi:hypothetical protein
MFKPASEAEILQYQYSTTYFSDKNDVVVIKRLKLIYDYRYQYLTGIFVNYLSIFLYIIKQAY